MQNQFQTEEPQPHYQTPAVTPPQELAVQEAAEQQQEQAVVEFVATMKKRARRNRLPVAFSILLPVIGLVMAPILKSINPQLDNDGYLRLYGFSLLGCLLSASICGILVVSLGPAKHIEELARLGSVRAIGPLIEIRKGVVTSRQLRKINDMLILLLPQLNSSHANLLNRRQRDFLNTILMGTNWDAMPGSQQDNLQLAILEAWKQVGDAQAIPIVRRLASPSRWSNKPSAIQQAAQECLPILEANFVNVLSTQTLLRASAPEPAGADTLLRPAASTTEHAPAELLRAANSDTPST